MLRAGEIDSLGGGCPLGAGCHTTSVEELERRVLAEDSIDLLTSLELAKLVAFTRDGVVAMIILETPYVELERRCVNRYAAQVPSHVSEIRRKGIAENVKRLQKLQRKMFREMSGRPF